MKDHGARIGAMIVLLASLGQGMYVGSLAAATDAALRHDHQQLAAKVDVIDRAQDDWHTAVIPEGIAVVHSEGKAMLAGHNHLDPYVVWNCPGCADVFAAVQVVRNTVVAQQQQAAQQKAAQQQRAAQPDMPQRGE